MSALEADPSASVCFFSEGPRHGHYHVVSDDADEVVVTRDDGDQKWIVHDPIDGDPSAVFTVTATEAALYVRGESDDVFRFIPDGLAVELNGTDLIWSLEPRWEGPMPVCEEPGCGVTVEDAYQMDRSFQRFSKDLCRIHYTDRDAIERRHHWGRSTRNPKV